MHANRLDALAQTAKEKPDTQDCPFRPLIHAAKLNSGPLAPRRTLRQMGSSTRNATSREYDTMPKQMTLKAQANGVEVHLWTDDAPSNALDQLKHIASLPIIAGHVAAMPDVHLGKGAAVGTVIPTRAAVIPAAVGVDIGCGMHALKLDLNASRLPDNLRNIRDRLETRIPVGFAHHDRLESTHARRAKRLEKRIDALLERRPDLARRRPKVARNWPLSLGTLGGGNHFIELSIDEDDHVWLVLHSGSRGLGAAIGEYFISAAREEAIRLKRRLPDRDLAWLDEGTRLFDDYVHAVELAQDFALENRRAMVDACLDELRKLLPPFAVADAAIECHHNYVALEHHFGEDLIITRKGAIRADFGEFGIVPGSMGTATYLVKGLGNPESYVSCAHGAGRKFSRREAKRRYTAEDLARETTGIECRKDSAIIDELPSAYRDIETVIEHQRDLATPVHRLTQLVNIKG